MNIIIKQRNTKRLADVHSFVHGCEDILQAVPSLKFKYEVEGTTRRLVAQDVGQELATLLFKAEDIRTPEMRKVSIVIFN
jgi:hypothetical protein